MSDHEFWNPLVPELLVRDFQYSLSFYCDLLGFDIRYQRSAPSFAYLQRGCIQIMLQQLDNDGWQVGELQAPFGRGMNLQMEVDQLEPLLLALEENGVSLFRQPQEIWYPTGNRASGQREFLVQDPDGYLLRFCQYLGERDQP
ncbi:bleomycin resistance protein [Halioxenophilus aromaticivorans]|uniref:Bleomycin resistance protein n=1 Tax=Halioxenophilus aromaticivorans TaxID=1306992 RepID=A0AAV3TZ76_9ALTE